MENESVKFETGANAPKGDPLSFIITDMAQNEHLRESSDLAQTIQKGMKKYIRGPIAECSRRTSRCSGIVYAGGAGRDRLRQQSSEATYLSDDSNQRALARNIASSVIDTSRTTSRA